ncbi:Protein scaf8-like isoform x1 [Lasiodiplodia theobromae]|uniref:Protein scaf8-like isoform x1 n=1 Tax=Lasiodiplodia theobromae TaxID=45133 RepID=UPI0015C3EE53|nr:Protein scaf8-like isoform x1 [Lasiodiplodia theobromae]KAF4545340.1 Protein scaf8-like isoform x1 [Lasiodiplodia theobromae]
MPLLRIFANKYSPRRNASAYSTQPASPSSKPLLAPQPSPPSSSATSFSSSPLATPSTSRTAYRRLSLQDIHLLTRILSLSSSCGPDDFRIVDKQSSRGSTPKGDTAGGAKTASSGGCGDDDGDGGDKGGTPPVSPQLLPSSLSPITNETIRRIRTRLRIAELPSHLRQCMSPATAATAVAAEAGSWASGLGLMVVEGDYDKEGAEDDDLRVKEVLALLGRAKGELVSWFENERRTVIATVNAIIVIVLVPVSTYKLSAAERCAKKRHTSDILFRADHTFVAWENVVIAPPQRLPCLCPHSRRQRTGAHSGAARLAAGVVPMGAPGQGIEAVGVGGWVDVVGVYARGCG